MIQNKKTDNAQCKIQWPTVSSNAKMDPELKMRGCTLKVEDKKGGEKVTNCCHMYKSS